MALSIQYVNEVLGQFSFTAVMDTKDWNALSHGLKCTEALPLERLVVGRMSFQHFQGGYQGLLDKLSTLQAERDQLLKTVEQLHEERNQLLKTQDTKAQWTEQVLNAG